MSAITIHDIDENLARRLSGRAAAHGRTVEEEARDILQAALDAPAPPCGGFGHALHAFFQPLGGIALTLPEREPVRPPPDLA